MLVYFRPMDLDRRPEFEARLPAGVFVGWHVQPGMVATHDYLVIAVEDFHGKGKG